MMIIFVFSAWLSINKDLNSTQEHLVNLAKITAMNLEGPLVFEDVQGANDVLKSLIASQHIVYADVMDKDNQLIAQFQNSLHEEKYNRFIDSLPVQKDRTVKQVIFIGNKVVGTLTVREHLDYVWAAQITLLSQMALVFSIAFFISLIWARRLSTAVVNPVLKISAIARNVEQGGSYTQQVRHDSDDEVGLLADEFNNMLATINARDQALRESETRLRLSQEGGGVGAWEADLISYTQVWSKNCIEMLGFPADTQPSWSDFLSIVHPKDRQLVINATESLTEPDQKFNVEYRITSHGAIRWMRSIGQIERDANNVPIKMRGVVLDISARKQIEDAMKSNTLLLEAQLNTTVDGVLIVNQNHKKLLINPRFIKLFNVPQRIADDADDRSLLQHIVSLVKFPDQFLEKLNYIYDHEDMTSSDEIELKDGSTLDRYSSPIVDKNGTKYGRIWTFHDITENKKAKATLLESHNLLRTIIDNAPLEIYWKDLDSRYLGCNKAFAASAGFTYPNEIIGKVDSEMKWTDEANQDRAYDNEIMKSCKPMLSYEHSKIIDGEIHWGHTYKVPLKNSANETIGLMGIDENITQRKIAEQNLRIAAIAFQTQEGMCITDANNIIIKVNDAFTTITGYSATEAIGLTPRLLSSGHHGAEFYETMWNSVKADGYWAGEIYNRRKNGDIYPQHLTITIVKNEAGIVTNHVATLTDITLSKAAADKIEQLAFYDPLTNLPNRRLLLDRLNHALAASKRSKQLGALLFLDLDHFKTLNDTLGHDVGDLLLQQVAQKLTACVREGDTVSRFGGDEFIILLEDLGELELEAAEKAEAIATKIMLLLNEKYLLETNEYHCSSSIGISLFNNHLPIDDLLKQADIAMYQAKKAGRNAMRFFNPQMQATINNRADLERELRKAIDNQQFQLYYQIQVNQLGHPIGAEALIRWLHPERGLIPPLQFIPLAEETGLILPIGHWVLDTACAQLKIWQKNARTRNMSISVNVSAHQFFQADFMEQVQDAVTHHGINTAQLKLELTESMLLSNIENTITTMNALRKIGIRFELDDFGTGYSSLQYLKKLPLYQLKIDQTFVRDIAVDANDLTLVRTIVNMARNLNLEVIAEGVETEEQRELLLSSQCKRYQGYLFGRPEPIEQFEAALPLTEILHEAG